MESATSRPDGTDASRLDRVYSPLALSPSDCEVVTCPISDHDAVTVSFQPPESWPAGRGFCKMNTEILTEADYRKQFKARYEGWRTLRPAFSTGTPPHFTQSSSILIRNYVGPAFVPACIAWRRRKTIKFYRDVTKYVIDRRIKTVRGVHGAVQKYPLDIVEVFKSYCEQLYPRADVDEGRQQSLVDNIEKTPSKEQNDELGSPLTVDELWKAVAKMKGGKAPGSDGIPVEFYKSFCGTVGYDLRDVFVAFPAGSLSPSQRTAVMTLLPKSGDLFFFSKSPLTLWRRARGENQTILPKEFCSPKE
ncbi:hypothetical protein HOLleu_43898 [Holothuria leucospilota]|uniref:Uncharacterized protein n=1 Tax=Holothuria leucospilota TaxID=206669 RepID=A0A9Q1BB84_HOLLE|nr:hypothetical protein HOLleu_43898 [Holothuria leucospilota]